MKTYGILHQHKVETSLAKVCDTQERVYRVFRKAINEANESFQTHNGGAIIKRRRLSATAEAAVAIYYSHKYF